MRKSLYILWLKLLLKSSVAVAESRFIVNLGWGHCNAIGCNSGSVVNLSKPYLIENGQTTFLMFFSDNNNRDGVEG
jgi:hypothetical protein